MRRLVFVVLPAALRHGADGGGQGHVETFDGQRRGTSSRGRGTRPPWLQAAADHCPWGGRDMKWDIFLRRRCPNPPRVWCAGTGNRHIILCQAPVVLHGGLEGGAGVDQGGRKVQIALDLCGIPGRLARRCFLAVASILCFSTESREASRERMRALQLHRCTLLKGVERMRSGQFRIVMVASPCFPLFRGGRRRAGRVDRAAIIIMSDASRTSCLPSLGAVRKGACS